MTEIEVDVWVRGTNHAATHRISSVDPDTSGWTTEDVRRLMSEMLLAIEREKNPDGEAPPVALRGFSWIVSPYGHGAVVLHIEMQMGTASAGPFAITEATLTEMVKLVMSGEVIH
jgi:hypothetical protein